MLNESINPCRMLSLMCSNYSDLEGYDLKRPLSKEEIDSVKRLEKLLCETCKENCKKYKFKRIVYRKKRMFKK